MALPSERDTLSFGAVVAFVAVVTFVNDVVTSYVFPA